MFLTFRHILPFSIPIFHPSDLKDYVPLRFEFERDFLDDFIRDFFGRTDDSIKRRSKPSNHSIEF
ncbi:hypothetical protein LEP1GSC070_3411 [Leptospira santarosai str. AIM]|nr:hypothetical protein LEP1GSC070_3411 [Leptospira santarosai str. AIM]